MFSEIWMELELISWVKLERHRKTSIPCSLPLETTTKLWQGYLKIEDGLIEKKKGVWRKRVGEVGGEGKRSEQGIGMKNTSQWSLSVCTRTEMIKYLLLKNKKRWTLKWISTHDTRKVILEATWEMGLDIKSKSFSGYWHTILRILNLKKSFMQTLFLN